jgi:hypothetical protein
MTPAMKRWACLIATKRDVSHGSGLVLRRLVQETGVRSPFSETRERPPQSIRASPGAPSILC